MTRPLVVVADDAGLAPESDAAILRCHREGIVGAASVVAGGPSSEQFLEAARETSLDLGLHLNLTEGPAHRGEIPGLTQRGRFLDDKRATWNALAALVHPDDALRAEVAAQWAWLVERGVDPVFVNGHNHVHVFPAVAEALRDVIRDRRLFVRDPSPAHSTAALSSFPWPRVLDRQGLQACFPRAELLEAFAGFAFSTEATLAQALAPWEVHSGARGEWMVHPGHRSGSAFARSPVRDDEMSVLCDPRIVEGLAARGWQPTTYGELV